MRRRSLLKAGALSAAAFLASTASAIAGGITRAGAAAASVPRRVLARRSQPAAQGDTPQYDYVVVGSGAGGGTVAARLAEAGYSVIVLEAGGDDESDNYKVPAFHPFATEDPRMRWDFYVRHYDDQKKEAEDPNYEPKGPGFWYPRAATLGGCTAHHAMILVHPNPSDWDQIADITGDPSWRADNMRRYFEKIEDCRHRPLHRFLKTFGRNPSRHGYDGWLATERPDPGDAFRDDALRRTLVRSFRNALREFGLPTIDRLESLGDPNDWRAVSKDAEGPRFTPQTTRDYQRVGPRERLRDVEKRHPLTLELNALATQVLFDTQMRAIGVEYQKGERLYQAHPDPSSAPGVTRRVLARREVILAGGAFNTPQLLMLSGIGPAAVLDEQKITARVALDGVGRNLQDRYEVAVVSRARERWRVLEGVTFTAEDRHYEEWKNDRRGIYTSNGALMCVITRSSEAAPAPDLFLYSVLADFRGYKPGYSNRIRQNQDRLAWVVLKGHTRNTAGEVTLASADPRARPRIHFKYFEDGSAGADEDVRAVVEGIALVRRLNAGLSEFGLEEEMPGPEYQTQEQLEAFVRTHAWGHHASCTCRIGPRERGGVVSGDFKVHGTQGLRIVDASVFPRTPGLFIVSAVYMIGEKAADVILAEARE